MIIYINDNLYILNFDIGLGNIKYDSFDDLKLLY